MAFEQIPVNGFRICIDQITTDIAGTVISPLKKEPIPFVGFSELLLLMDREFDLVGYPESFQEKRIFLNAGHTKLKEATFHGVPQAVLSTEEIRKNEGTKDTVEVIVNSRRNASWQGEVFGITTDWSKSFASEVELLSAILSRGK